MPATVSQRLVNNVDLAPTLCRAAGLRPDAAMRGEDLGNGKARREIVFCEAGPHQTMARTKSHKLILNDGPEGKSLFFDLRKRPLGVDQSLWVAASPGGDRSSHGGNRRMAAEGNGQAPSGPSPRRRSSGRTCRCPSDGHRKTIEEYYRAKMQEAEKRP